MIRAFWKRFKAWINPPLTPIRVTLGAPNTFDWLRDYGKLWEPGSTAFWLAPSTPDELAAWLFKYRPSFVGVFEAAGLRVEIFPAKQQLYSDYHRYLQNLYVNNYAFSQVSIFGQRIL